MPADRYERAPRLPEGDRLDPRALFDGEPRPVELDVGCGRGGFLVERALMDPRVRIVGLEMKRKLATLLDERVQRLGLSDRAKVFAEDAKLALARFPDRCASLVCFHFPDPWWKKRHEKRLLVVPSVLADVARILVQGGELFIQTDVPERATRYELAVAAVPRLEPIDDASARVGTNPYGAASHRERSAVRDGLPVHRLRYVVR